MGGFVISCEVNDEVIRRTMIPAPELKCLFTKPLTRPSWRPTRPATSPHGVSGISRPSSPVIRRRSNGGRGTAWLAEGRALVQLDLRRAHGRRLVGHRSLLGARTRGPWS